MQDFCIESCTPLIPPQAPRIPPGRPSLNFLTYFLRFFACQINFRCFGGLPSAIRARCHRAARIRGHGRARGVRQLSNDAPASPPRAARAAGWQRSSMICHEKTNRQNRLKRQIIWPHATKMDTRGKLFWFSWEFRHGWNSAALAARHGLTRVALETGAAAEPAHVIGSARRAGSVRGWLLRPLFSRASCSTLLLKTEPRF